jgi:hypothetical protein
MRVAQVGLVANGTSGLNLLRRGGRKASNLVRISGFRVIRPRAMASLTSLLGSFLPFERLQVSRSGETFVGVVVAALADLGAHVLTSVRLLKTVRRLSAAGSKEECEKEERTEPCKKTNERHRPLAGCD